MSNIQTDDKAKCRACGWDGLETDLVASATSIAYVHCPVCGSDNTVTQVEDETAFPPEAEVEKGIAHWLRSAKEQYAAAETLTERAYWNGSLQVLRDYRAQPKTEDELQAIFEQAKEDHSNTNGILRAYHQGQKDGVRRLLAAILNQPGYIDQIDSSQYSLEQARRAFVPVAPETLHSPEQCIECGATYFHQKGCQHGGGLSLEEFAKRLPQAKEWLSRRGVDLDAVMDKQSPHRS